MSNIIVYTYKSPKYKIHKRVIDIKKWMTASVKSAKKVGYFAEVYTDDLDLCNDIGFDVIHHIEDNNFLWDSFKIYVLENRTDNYFLSDYDVIYKSKLDFNNSVDIYFDGWENMNWQLYKDGVNKLKSKSIIKSEYWDYKERITMNVGILKINNNELKSVYINEWKSAYNSIYPNIDHFDVIKLTPILTQYLLTTIVSKLNFSYEFFTEDEWLDYNQYYRHFVGNRKYSDYKVII